MTHRQLKAGYFTLAGMNTLATSYYFNYLFFYLRDHFGFGNRQNLWVTALSGFIYIFAAWQCGKFAARFLGIAVVFNGWKVGFVCHGGVLWKGRRMLGGCRLIGAVIHRSPGGGIRQDIHV